MREAEAAAAAAAERARIEEQAATRRAAEVSTRTESPSPGPHESAGLTAGSLVPRWVQEAAALKARLEAEVRKCVLTGASDRPRRQGGLTEGRVVGVGA